MEFLGTESKHNLLGASAGLLLEGTLEYQHLACSLSSANLMALTILSPTEVAAQDLIRAAFAASLST